MLKINSDLFLFSLNGYLEKVKETLSEGAYVNSTDDFYWTPLHFAAEKGHLDVVKLLIEKGANVNAKGGCFNNTALHLASKYGHKDIVKLLIEKGAHIDTKNKYDWTPLHVAA